MCQEGNIFHHAGSLIAGNKVSMWDSYYSRVMYTFQCCIKKHFIVNILCFLIARFIPWPTQCVLSRWFITTWSTWSEPNTNTQLQQPSQQIQAQTHQLEYGESAHRICNSWYFTRIIHQRHKNSQVACLAATCKWFFSLELQPFSTQWAPLLHTSLSLWQEAEMGRQVLEVNIGERCQLYTNLKWRCKDLLASTSEVSQFLTVFTF